MAFTLTLLGTDTSFTPGAAKNGYDKAETLSYISTLINDTSTGPTDAVVHLRNDDVVVIDGPSTLGSEVGDRIARGVAAILEAISRGETDISIIAHSRGAVEAILVTHELERIQNLLNQPGNFKPELCNSVCSYTKTAMNGLHKSSFDQLNWGEISKHMDKIKLSMLNIDPVPGGNILGISHATTVAWRDPRFYEVPKIVNEYNQFVYENERSRCFKPIVPKCVSKDTKFVLSSLPGHHGTGSGNLLDQQRRTNPTNKTTEHVQELAVVKLIDFLTHNKVRITPRTANNNDPFTHLTSGLFNDDLSINQKKLKTTYLDLFNQIMANRVAYQHYNTTNYSGLGQEQAFKKLLWLNIEQRIMHFQGHNDTYLETIFPPVPGGHFLNYEHARMHLNHELGLENNIPLSETINQSVSRLLKICEHSNKLQTLKKANTPVDITASVLGDKIAPTLETEEGFAHLLDGVGTLIEEVRQSYLQNKLIDSNEQTAVKKAVHYTFKTFEVFTTKYPNNEIAQKIFTTFKSNLESTLAMKHKVLKDHYLDLTERMKEQKLLNALHDKIQNIIENIEDNESKDNLTKTVLVDNLTAFANEIKSLNSQTSSTEQINKLLEVGLAKLSNLELVGDLAISSQDLAGLLIIEAIEDNQVYRIDNIIREVITSYNDLDSFRKALTDFKELDSSINYQERETNLEEQRARVVELAAKYIAEHDIPVEAIKHLFGEENQPLYQQITGLAIGLGAVNPLTLDIAKQRDVIIELGSTKNEQAQVIQSLTSKTDEQARLIQYLTSDYEIQAALIKSLTNDKAKQSQLISELTTSKETQAALIKGLTSDKTKQAQLISELTTSKEEQAALISELTSDKTKQAQLISELTTSKEEQAALISELTSDKTKQAQLISELTTSKEEQAALISELTSDKTKQAQLISELTTSKEEQAALISELTSDKTKQAQLISELTTSKEEQAALISELTSDKTKQAQLISELTTSKEEQAALISELTSDKTKQAQLISELTTSKEEQAALISELTSDKTKQAQLISELTTSKEEQAALISELTSDKTKQAQLISELTTSKEEQAALISELTSDKTKQAQLISELTTSKEEQAALIKGLTSDKTKQAQLISELTTSKETQAALIKSLTSDHEQQADLIKGLTADNAKQAQLISELTTSKETQAALIKSLTSDHEQQAALIKRLTSDKTKQAQLISELTTSKETQAALIKSLTSDHEQQAALIKRLTTDTAKQAQLISELTTSKETQAVLIKSLTSEHEQQAALIKGLTADNAKQAQLINGLTTSSEEQLQLINELTTSKEEQADLIKELTSAKQELSEENTTLAQQVTELTSQLEKLKLERNAASIDNDEDMEFKFQTIVKNKLSPMTKDYLLHLAKEVKQKIDPNLDISTYSKLAENVRAIKQWPEDQASQVLKQKFEAVSELNDILASKNKPSEKVEQFYQKLKESDKALSEHRDPAWKRYTANALIVLSIIVTGIIPGLIALGAVALAGNTPKFWQASGQTFFQRANKEIENNKPEPENDVTKKMG